MCQNIALKGCLYSVTQETFLGLISESPDFLSDNGLFHKMSISNQDNTQF